MEFAFSALFDVIADACPDREALVWRTTRLSYRAVRLRADRFAQVLHAAGVGLRSDPEVGDGWQSPHDHVALYLRNGNAYLEGMLGAWRARAAATNVNYRYVDDELAEVLADQSAAAIVYHGSFAATLERVLERIDPPRILLRVDDGTGDDLLPGAVDYEAALASVTVSGPPRDDWSSADRYILYTGGTTGSPKGVLWRQADFMVRALGLTRADGSDFESANEVVERAVGRAHLRSMPLPPFMHGAAHWNALSTWLSGGTVVIQDQVDRFDPIDALSVATRERVTAAVIVGDAFARPLVDALDEGAPIPGELRHLLSSGAILSRPIADGLRARLPDVRILDVLGSSEAGRQGIKRTVDAEIRTSFRRDAGSEVVSADHTRFLEAGDDEIGWLATTGRVPLGYLGDPAKTAATFPTVEGRRVVIPGDRARLLADGSIELHGRESVTINSGGEKIFAEEVERAVKEHPAVADALVVGRPSERWGSEVVAVVSLRSGQEATADDLAERAGRHVARFKVPKAFVFVDQVPRSPSGKPDYAAARDLV